MSTWTADPKFADLYFRGTEIEHLDGVAWWEAPVPRRPHRHRAQTRGWLNYFSLIERCACGAARKDGKGRWTRRERKAS